MNNGRKSDRGLSHDVDRLSSRGRNTTAATSLMWTRQHRRIRIRDLGRLRRRRGRGMGRMIVRTRLPTIGPGRRQLGPERRVHLAVVVAGALVVPVRLYRQRAFGAQAGIWDFKVELQRHEDVSIKWKTVTVHVRRQKSRENERERDRNVRISSQTGGVG